VGASMAPAFPAIDWTSNPPSSWRREGRGWLEFVGRASTAVRAIALAVTSGERVVLACHAGVVESSIFALPADLVRRGAPQAAHHPRSMIALT